MSTVTPRPWTYGVRKDASIWISLGDPLKRHSQFDWLGREEDAKLAMAAPDLLESLREILHLAKEWGKDPKNYTQAESNIIGFAEAVIDKAEK